MSVENEMGQTPDTLPPTLTTGNLIIDLIAGCAHVDGVDLLLTKTELTMLKLFAQNEGKILSTEVIYENAWKRPMRDYKRSLQRRISDLRTKLSDGQCSHTISNVYGVGYCFKQP